MNHAELRWHQLLVLLQAPSHALIHITNSRWRSEAKQVEGAYRRAVWQVGKRAGTLIHARKEASEFHLPREDGQQIGRNCSKDKEGRSGNIMKGVSGSQSSATPPRAVAYTKELKLPLCWNCFATFRLDFVRTAVCLVECAAPAE